MRIAGITKDSYVNGPGRRNVLHVQGCTIACPGCFNKHTWGKRGGREISYLVAARELMRGEPEGITISGGEPMEQWPDVKKTIEELLVRKPGLSVVIFTGWTKDQLEESGYLSEMEAPYYMNSSRVSLVISGPFIEELACNEPLISSSNQELIYTNPAYERENLTEIPRVEVHCEDGLVKISGLPDGNVLSALTNSGR